MQYGQPVKYFKSVAVIYILLPGNFPGWSPNNVKFKVNLHSIIQPVNVQWVIYKVPLAKSSKFLAARSLRKSETLAGKPISPAAYSHVLRTRIGRLARQPASSHLSSGYDLR